MQQNRVITYQAFQPVAFKWQGWLGATVDPAPTSGSPSYGNTGIAMTVITRV